MPLNPRFKTHRWFLENVVGHVGDECLIWPYSRSGGYPNMWIGGRIQYVHRLVCEMVNGPAPTDKHHAAHSCGRGHEGCLTPSHLSWKTPSENMLDKRIHGKFYRSGRKKKITAENVATIRSLAGVVPQTELAARFGICRRHVGKIINRETWR